MKKAIYPGSFDPLTFGHLDVIRRASKIFNPLLVAVAQNEEKHPLFSLEERQEMLKEAVQDIQGVEVSSFTGLLVEYCSTNKIGVVIRGLRAISDFEFEFQMALTNKKICDSVETIFMMPNETYSYLSSRIIKEISKMGGDISSFVPTHVTKRLHQKFKNR